MSLLTCLTHVIMNVLVAPPKVQPAPEYGPWGHTYTLGWFSADHPVHASQTSLRPILVNLAYYNKLKLPLLRGLARLLKLLASWFNVTLGEFCPKAPGRM